MARKIRVLFIPLFLGVPSHFITLLQLYRRLDPARYECAFYLSRYSPDDRSAATMSESLRERMKFYYDGRFYAKLKVPVLEVMSNNTLSSEFTAYGKFKPDVIIDDCSLITGLARQLRKIPRITILRTGTFKLNTPGNRAYRHTLDALIQAMPDMSGLGVRSCGDLSGYCEAEARIVPGTASLERLGIEPDSRMFFSGPLLMGAVDEEMFEADGLRTFLAAHSDNRLAYMTYGTGNTVEDEGAAHRKLIECFRYLFSSGFGVISNLELHHPDFERLIAEHRSKYFFSHFLPMHRICAAVDVMVHVCGSAAYHYPILHQKPAITMGTQYYDREDVARNLQSLGLSRHIPAAAEEENFVGLFKQCIDDILQSRYPFDPGLNDRFRKYKDEIARTAAGFDIDKVIEAALSG